MENDPISGVLTVISWLGLVVFAVSGALAAGRRRLDPIGYMLLGTLTAIGGGSVRDVLLGKPAFWIAEPLALAVSLGVAALTFWLVPESIERRRVIQWSDAAGLAAFAVGGAEVARSAGASLPAIGVLGVLSATGGGVIRDLLSGVQPMILAGQLYATAAIAAVCTWLAVLSLGLGEASASAAGFCVGFVVRALAIHYDIRLGPPGAAVTVKRP